jgi:phosphate transport system ATP-binding protein
VALSPERSPAVETKLEIAQLNVWYESTQALRNVGLSVGAGRAVALIGPAQSGKTTLLRACNRLLDENPAARISGSLKIDGSQMLGPAVDVATLRRRAGMVFPRPTLLPLSLFENVAFGLRAAGLYAPDEIAARVERALQRALVWDAAKNVLHAPAYRLTADQQQRVCLARVLALDPDIILLDDPTSAFDPVAQREFEEVIALLRRDCTLLLATHNLQQAARLSDTTCFLVSGEIVESGETQLVFSRPTDPRTEDFLAGRPPRA